MWSHHRHIVKTAFLAVFSFVVLHSPYIFGQEKCATHLLPGYTPESVHRFESWIQKLAPLQRGESEVVELPVVVHVVHNGERIGFGPNISEDQILSQIEVLNEDFRRQNINQEDTNPLFQDLAADLEIQFRLARRDPEGLPTNGIVRIQGSQVSYDFPDNVTLKEVSYWPSDKYINLWVAPLDGNFIGWAQFPQSTLDGLEEVSENPLTDGVVIDYQYFGSRGNINTGTGGRTATHELGHYFGLRHIWGDGDCNFDDFVEDTPEQSGPNYGCDGRNTCNSEDMIQNFLDYTTDNCMTLFTEGQKARVRTVLANSPRRASLLTSLGGQDPVSIENDLGLRTIFSPQTSLCSPEFTPSVEVRNYGVNLIGSLAVAMFLDGEPVDTVNLESAQLRTLDITTLEFAPQTLPANGAYALEFRVVSVNDSQDFNNENNLLETQVVWANEGRLPQRLSFEGGRGDWVIYNPDRIITWQQQVLTIDGLP
ncbi:MAG TPA: Pregnancy-associated plasma protein-A, partial [Cytophagales bacterium]|nr:Pregnancy-associated plasma protein-A [Cytophagales bacterium]